MNGRLRRERARTWAWVYLAIFGAGDNADESESGREPVSNGTDEENDSR